LEFTDINTIPEKVKPLFTDVAIEYKPMFNFDIVNSLKEVAGIPSIKTNKLFNDVDNFNNCINYQLMRPFDQDTIVVSTKDSKNKLIQFLNPNFRGNKKYIYYFGIDQSLSGCNTGLALCHIDENGKCIIDMMFSITPPAHPAEISPKHIREFIVYLMEERDFDIEAVITDTYNNADTKHFFEERDCECYDFSVERLDPYLLLKNKMANHEIEFYDYNIFRKELLNLLVDEKKGTVSHPKNPDSKSHKYSKDVSDTVCRVVNCLFLYSYSAYKNTGMNTIMEIVKMQKEKQAGIIIADKNRVLKQEQKLFGREKLIKL
jgi:hypothetical protein